jgi:hypothetical protein
MIDPASRVVRPRHPTAQIVATGLVTHGVMPDVPHVSTVVRRPWRRVYDYAADPTNLPHWAAGLSSAALVPADGGWWTASSPMGTVGVRFSEPNAFGVLDHVVRLPDGTEVLNPMRVVPWGDDAEVVFTVRPRAGMTDADVEADVAAVAADLETLRGILESEG